MVSVDDSSSTVPELLRGKLLLFSVSVSLPMMAVFYE